MSTGNRVEPFNAMNFRVEIDGVAVSAFSEVSGLSAEIGVIEYRDGSDRTGVSRKLPGLYKVSNVTLKRGIAGDLTLWNWIHDGATGNVSRRNVAIVLLNEKSEPVMRFLLRDAWPVKWEGPNLKADANEIAIESLELAHEGLSVEKP